MRLFRPPFVGFKIFIADFIMVHPIRQGKKNIGMAWHIVSMFVYDFAKAREVFTPQRNLCAQQDSVAFALQPLLVCFDRFARRAIVSKVTEFFMLSDFPRVAPFRWPRHDHRVWWQLPAFLSREFDAVGLAKKALHRNRRLRLLILFAHFYFARRFIVIVFFHLSSPVGELDALGETMPPISSSTCAVRSGGKVFSTSTAS